MILREMMTVRLVTASEEQSVRSALEIMRRFHIRHLLVTDKRGYLSGLTTDRDLRAIAPSSLIGAKSRESDVLDKKLRDVMVRNPAVASAATSLEEAAKVMYIRKIGALPVINESGRPEGIVTATDLLGVMAGLKGPAAPAARLA